MFLGGLGSQGSTSTKISVHFKVIKMKVRKSLILALNIQVNNHEIVVNFFHIGHNLTRYSAIVNKLQKVIR